MDTQSDSAQAEFEARVEALRRRYVAGLPARRAALAAAWDACRDAGDDAPWQQLREVAHNLSGSAPCYGFETLGRAARDLDRMLSGQAPCRARADAADPVAGVLAALDAVVGTD